jgi:hypothetical protein
VAAVRKAAESLVADRLLLPEDAARLIVRDRFQRNSHRSMTGSELGARAAQARRFAGQAST